MPKLAIYVPKKEMVELEKWRKKINFSKVFMRAVMGEIRDRRRKSKPNEKAAAAARHYRKQLSAESESLEDAGFRLGSSHVMACRLTIQQIRDIQSIDQSESLPAEGAKQIEKWIGNDVHKMDSALKDSDESSRQALKNLFMRAYVKGVLASWREVCDQM